MKGLVSFFFILNTLIGIAQQPKLVVPMGHTSNLKAAIFSPDGKYVLTVSNDKTAKLWDANTGALVTDLTGHTSGLKCAAFSNDAKYIVTGSYDKTAIIWNVATGELIKEFGENGGSVGTAVFSPDDKKLLTASNYDKTAKIWDIQTGSLITELIGHAGRSFEIISAQFSLDGKKIITTATDQTSKIWNAATGKLLIDIEGGSEEKVAAVFSPDSKKVITASADNKGKIWDANTGLLLTTLSGHTNNISAVMFSSDNQKILTASTDKTAKIWNAITGALIITLKGHTEELYTSVFSPDSKKVFTCSINGAAKIWDANTGRLLKTFIGMAQFSVQSKIFSPDSKRVVTVTPDYINRNWAVYEGQIWDIETGKLLQKLSGHTFQTQSVIYNPGNTQIATIATDSVVKIFSTSTASLLFSLKEKAYPNEYFRHILSYDPGNKIILFRGSNYRVYAYDASSGIKRFLLIGHSNNVYYATFSHDSKKIITVSEDKTAKLWDAVTGKLLNTLQGHISSVYWGAFSYDNQKIVTASHDGTSKIWDANTGSLIATINYDEGALYYAAFSPDNEKIIVRSRYNTAKICDAATGKILIELEHKDNVSTVLFSKDSKRILTASWDKTAKIWDATTGKLLIDLEGHTGGVNYAGFNSDENEVVTASGDNTVKIWNANTGELIRTIDLGATTSFEAVSYSKNQIIASRNSELLIFDLSTGKQLCLILPIDVDDWLTKIPSGYYMCTQNAAKLLHYKKGLQSISFEQLDIRYNRPDKVLSAIGNTDTSLIKSYRKAWEKRAKKLGVDTTAFKDGYSVPEADFANRDVIEYEQKNSTFILKIKGVDSSYKLDRFNIWVNEVPIYGQRGINIHKKNKNDFDTTITIKLSHGENRIETSVTNVNGIESYRIPLLVKYAPVNPVKEATHFIGIGIDQFADDKYNLQYSSKDIRDLANKLKEKYGNAIRIDTLFNQQVTVNNVKALKNELLNTNENDKIIIAYSGHGMLSKDYDYYLSTYNVNFEKPEENGLPYDELENLLDSIPARKKLLLIDACHSGEVDKEDLVTLNASSDSLVKGLKPVAYKKEGHLGLKNSFELMQSLFVNVGKSTGATIISAAAGTQFALERNDLKNGVFTYSILEAMKGHPTLKISELKEIVGKRVEELTKGLQKPTSRNEMIAVDWNVW